MRSLVALSLVPAVAGSVHADDLKRARTMKPRSGYQGAGSVATANKVLNRHLHGMDGVAFKDCEKFTVEELRDVLRALHPMTSDELKDIYPSHDGRKAAYETLEEMEQHWSEIPSDQLVRDGHCHEAVMMFVHHLSRQVQQSVAQKVLLPKLPVVDHVVESRDDSDASGKFYDSKVTCQACHKGGLGNPFATDLGPPEEGSLDRTRRCYTNYEELYGITCGPCDGIAGPYWGDDTTQYFSPPTCVPVGTPEDIPEEERVPFAMPQMFSTRIVGGSDRWGRTTNPLEPDLAPFSEKQNHMYGQIHGKWYMKAPVDDDLWRLRHDTFYGNISWNGTLDVNRSMFFNLSQIHFQSRWQQENNITGEMVSLNRSGTWPPHSEDDPDYAGDPMCVCVPDPVGVPDASMTRAPGLKDLKYLGRFKLTPIEYLGRTVEMDHYANWFFHVMMEVNTSDPAYGKAPVRLASAYAGTAVYQDWVFEDPEITHPGIFSADIPTHAEKPEKQKYGKYCLNPTQHDFCSNIKVIDDEEGPATFPPKSSGFGDQCANHPACADLEGACCPTTDGARLACCDQCDGAGCPTPEFIL